MGKEEQGNGLLKHSVYPLASNKGVEECASWGDYFYVEALVTGCILVFHGRKPHEGVDDKGPGVDESGRGQ